MEKQTLVFKNNVGNCKLLALFNDDINSLNQLTDNANNIINSICKINNYSMMFTNYDAKLFRNIPKIIL